MLAARLLGWLARGIRGPVRDAMLSDAAAPEARGRAFGLHRALDSLGAVLGPVAAAAILARSSLHAVFWWSLVPGVLSALAFAAFVRPQRAGPAHHQHPLPDAIAMLPPAFRRFLVAAFAFGLGDFARSLLILRATNVLAPGFGAAPAAAIAVALYALHNVVYALASYPVGWWADRTDAKALLLVGYVLGTATAVLAAAARPSIVFLGVLFATGGLTLAFVDTLEGVLTAAFVPAAVRGTGFGVLAATNGVGDLLSSSAVGIVWATAGPVAAFVGAAGLCAVGAAALLQLDSVEKAA